MLPLLILSLGLAGFAVRQPAIQHTLAPGLNPLGLGAKPEVLRCLDLNLIWSTVVKETFDCRLNYNQNQDPKATMTIRFLHSLLIHVGMTRVRTARTQ
jgi:hypothetical protein